jgi:thiol-disulfide isomerase/thioredoxin
MILPQCTGRSRSRIGEGGRLARSGSGPGERAGATTSWIVAMKAPLAAALLVCPGCEGPAANHPLTGRRVGPLPLVSLSRPGLDPPRVDGRVTLLNFWATWCPPCRRELPGLARLAGRLADEPGFQLVAVSCGSGREDVAELAAETLEFLERQGLEISPWGFGDPVGRSVFSSAMGLDALPTTYLIGPDGRVRQVWQGFRARDEADMARAVAELLKELPAAAPRPAA